MNFKKLLFLFIFLNALKAFSASSRDSIGVENLNGKKVILHQIEAKETYYSLGRKYNVSPQSIMQFNNSMALHPADIIKIPTQIDFVNAPLKFSDANNNYTIINHTVKPKESLYAIANKYGMKLEELKSLNNLTSNNLGIGDVLKVKIPTSADTPKNEINTNTEQKANNQNNPLKNIKYVDSVDSQTQIEIPKNRYGITEMNEKGLAVWISDNNLDGTKSYALHRTAPIGTIMKITNPMTDRSVFAKVVGRFTENEATKDVIIVITKAAADAIGTLDKRFQVNITFGIPNEQ